MVTAIRYIMAPGSAPLRGAPPVRELRVFYDLPAAEVRARLERAIVVGVEGVAESDLAGLDSGKVAEEALRRLFAPQALERAFVGTEEVGARRVV